MENIVDEMEEEEKKRIEWVTLTDEQKNLSGRHWRRNRGSERKGKAGNEREKINRNH